MIETIGSIFMLGGALVAVLAGLGLLRFESAYARFHAAGKASPVAFLIAAIGASFSLGWLGAGLLLFTVVAMVLTLPLAVHLLFRAVHRTGGDHLEVDELRETRKRAEQN